MSNFSRERYLASEYTLALHEPEHQVAVLLVNRHRGQTLQRMRASRPLWSRNFRTGFGTRIVSGSDVFIGMNPLKDGATSRTKESIREIRTSTSISTKTPKPPLRTCAILSTRRARTSCSTHLRRSIKVVWKIEGADLEQAESLLHCLGQSFGGVRGH